MGANCRKTAERRQQGSKSGHAGKMPSLGSMYNPDDGNMQMLYFEDAKATFYSFTEAPETVSF